MILTAENYFSREAGEEYISVSQYKDFMGMQAGEGCPACALAKLRGEWVEEKGPALMVGSYVDAHFEGTLAHFKASNPEIFMKSGGLKVEYRKAEKVISRIERDPYFMKFMSGEKQVIMTGEIGGAKWKIKIDSYIPNVCIVDLKIIKSIRELFWSPAAGKKINFIQRWGYDIQAGVYQEIVRQHTGRKLPFYIAAASKEKETDIEVIQLSDDIIEQMVWLAEINTPKILDWKEGLRNVPRCEKCDYCKHTKILTKPVLDRDLFDTDLNKWEQEEEDNE